MANYLRFLSAEDADEVRSYYTSIGMVYDRVNPRRLAALATQADMSSRSREAERFAGRFPWADFRWFCLP